LRWKKLGLVFNANQQTTWMQAHAYIPTAIQLDANRVRVFIAVRDSDNIGRIAWVDVKASDPTRVLAVSSRPALDIGVPGTFDDNGVSPTSVVRDRNGELRLYYVGWQLTPRVRYLLFTGLAISSDDGETFARFQQTPVLDRSRTEFLLRSGAHIICDEGTWKAWYAAGSSTRPSREGLTPAYNLHYAESADGLSWPMEGKPALNCSGTDEVGIGRSFIERHGDGFRMWASIRSLSKHYRIEYAMSANGIEWTRHGEQDGLTVSDDGWDSEMIGFPSIIDNEHGRFLFYNGNGYGATGFGVAALVSEQ